MSTPIYQIFIGKNNIASNLAWRAMPEDESKALQEKEQASRKDVGATFLLFCESAWADEEHPWWGVIRFPSIEARMEHTRTLQKIGWLNYTDAFSLLGTTETEPPAVTIPNPIYKLWVIRSNPAGSMSQAGMSRVMGTMVGEKHDALYKENNSLALLQCNSYWCNEAYPNFGVSVYPSIEANMRVQQGLADLGWQNYLDCFTILGTPVAL